MNRWVLALVAVLFLGGHAFAQDVVGDVLAGNLVKPKVGVWSWYDVTDPGTKSTLMLRLAVVGEKKVGGKQGHWLEIEVVPPEGYKSVYKMLITGPANDPKNVHEMFLREGTEEAKAVPVPTDAKGGNAAPVPESTKKPLGTEELDVAGKTLKTSHYETVQEGKRVEVWLSEEVSPMGIVKPESPTSTMILRAYGEGGEGARSVIDDREPKTSKKADTVKVQVQVEKDKGPETEPAKPTKRSTKK